MSAVSALGEAHAGVSDQATVIIVPGAFCGVRSLWKLLPALAARCVTAVGVDLPSCSASDNTVDVPR